jgi:hypothetical protein
MRNALYILTAACILSPAMIARAAEPVTVAFQYGNATAGVPLVSDAPFLPVRGRDLPLSSALDGSGSPQSSPQASTVEAIPTPTAFHAGGVLLLGLAAARSFRKLRIV